jgi:hypothetical protein
MKLQDIRVPLSQMNHDQMPSDTFRNMWPTDSRFCFPVSQTGFGVFFDICFKDKRYGPHEAAARAAFIHQQPVLLSRRMAGSASGNAGYSAC